ncbi:putative protein tyrosine kinase [Lyophyllum shimeji]|uniref:Protein kinase domain-containing protein n=1 Tax=Lyophyllum shimeji TaxID=47721 RepID=A0A9P3PFQ9_LYOSH|nr:putative protein tyrosine kinase [Lyophyllum shimeji]
MLRLIRGGVTTLELAGAVGGVPFAGVAAIAVREITQACDDVRVHRKKAKHMANRCTQILNSMNEQSQALVGTELQTKVDELNAIYETIQKRVRRWSRYNALTAFLKSSEVQQDLDLCERELDNAMKLFQMNAAIIANNQLTSAQELQTSHFEEIRGLIHQVLANRAGELGQVRDMQAAGEHVAERIMLEGQRELQTLREANNELMTNVQSHIHIGSRPSSPPPLPKDGQRYLEYQRGLFELHQLTGIPPSVKVLNGEVVKIGDLAIAGGTYSDIWQGIWLGKKKVALKALRNIKAADPKARKRFEHEVKVWADLHNDHILPFYGIVTDQGQHLQMVSPWQDNGNVLDYVKNTPDADRILLLSGAAHGLDYLHDRNITHGNVKCANILVTSEGGACICDFGMSKVIEEVTEKSASVTLTASGSARWLAPELIEGVVTSPTKEADVYSFAMAVLELLTGKHPFSNRRRDASVIHDVVVLKKIPHRPDEPEVARWLSDSLWALMTECWRVPASSRPSMHQVSERIQGIRSDAMPVDPNGVDTDAMDLS